MWLIRLAILDSRTVRRSPRYLFQRAPSERTTSIQASATRNPKIGSSSGSSAASRAFYISQTGRATFCTTSTNASKTASIASIASQAWPCSASAFSTCSTHARASGPSITSKAAEWPNSRMGESYKCGYCPTESVRQFANATSAC